MNGWEKMNGEEKSMSMRVPIRDEKMGMEQFRMIMSAVLIPLTFPPMKYASEQYGHEI